MEFHEPTRQRRRLMSYIRHRGGRITSRLLQNSNHSRYPTVAIAQVALEALVADGKGCWLTETTGGRPSQVFYLAPEPPSDEAGEE